MTAQMDWQLHVAKVHLYERQESIPTDKAGNLLCAECKSLHALMLEERSS